MIRIGGGVGGRFSRPIKDITCYENRILQNGEHSYFWTDSKFCIDNKIFLIVNIDTYMTGSRWMPSNQALRDFTIHIREQLKSISANKTNCRFTFDNESDEYLAENFDAYFNYIRVIHDALNGEFDLGAGNFRTARVDWYNTLGSKYSEGYFEVFDVHYQDGMDNESAIDLIAGKLNNIAKANGIKRVAVTEGNNFWDVSTPRGHDLLKYQINTAESFGCEDFCFPFVNWTINDDEGHGMMSYCLNDIPISSYWEDMLKIIKDKKPIIVEDEMVLDKLYKLGSKGMGIRFLQKVLNADIKPNPLLVVDGVWGVATADTVKQYQTFYSLKVDGLVGSQTMKSMILEYPEIWNEIEYLWAIGER